MNKVNIGGERLGSGAKMNVEMRNYSRSTHDLGYLWRTTMAPGTLVPFMNMVALPQDTFEIDLNADVKTLPTVGPLFGSFKLQMDVFSIPMRLYHPWLHNNRLGIGLKMENVKLPQMLIEASKLDVDSNIPLEFQQINQSSLLAYLGVRGVGNVKSELPVGRYFNGLSLLAYWDIYKNYYSNKQEEIGAFINSALNANETWVRHVIEIDDVIMAIYNYGDNIQYNTVDAGDNGIYSIAYPITYAGGWTGIEINYNGSWEKLNTKAILSSEENSIVNGIECKVAVYTYVTASDEVTGFRLSNAKPNPENIKIKTFDLNNIDDMRDLILNNTGSSPFVIDKNSMEPYGDNFKLLSNSQPAAQMSQQGLGLKTYQSDIFNNWISTEWIDGDNGISKITAISTVDDYFTIDTLNLSQKVYDMMNRIAISGGSYSDWLGAVYDKKPFDRPESPVYLGGLSKEVIFQEVISNAASDAQINNENSNAPLGTLAGRGILGNKHKGGKVVVKVSEPSIIMGLVSLTPRIDYSQGNDWSVHLKTLNDLHKPALDEIGFQELITEQMAFWDTEIDEYGAELTKSAGKQPAWINYMTAHNKTFGNFADRNKEMYMTLNRRYEADDEINIADLTTYIDPVKYNYMFAQTKIDAQNFWVQIAVDCEARRLMSAKVMPNL